MSDEHSKTERLEQAVVNAAMAWIGDDEPSALFDACEALRVHLAEVRSDDDDL